MRSNAEYENAMSLIVSGLSDRAVARRAGVPRSTIRDWRNGLHARRRRESRGSCRRCAGSEHGPGLERDSYAYLLGMYLGDGSIDRMPRTWRLRIALDLGWPEIVAECAEAMRDVFKRNRVFVYRPDKRIRCVVAVVYSNSLTCLIPQHGPGPKHLRSIELADWQTEIVVEQPEQFLRGLLHSDGCRFINRVRHGCRVYEYPRYNFTNASRDIRLLFTSTCDRLGVEWRQMNARSISIARRRSVAFVDEFVGPKR